MRYTTNFGKEFRTESFNGNSDAAKKAAVRDARKRAIKIAKTHKGIATNIKVSAYLETYSAGGCNFVSWLAYADFNIIHPDIMPATVHPEYE